MQNLQTIIRQINQAAIRVIKQPSINDDDLMIVLLNNNLREDNAQSEYKPAKMLHIPDYARVKSDYSLLKFLDDKYGNDDDDRQEMNNLQSLVNVSTQLISTSLRKIEILSRTSARTPLTGEILFCCVVADWISSIIKVIYKEDGDVYNMKRFVRNVYNCSQQSTKQDMILHTGSDNIVMIDAVTKHLKTAERVMIDVTNMIEYKTRTKNSHTLVYYAEQYENIEEFYCREKAYEIVKDRQDAKIDALTAENKQLKQQNAKSIDEKGNSRLTTDIGLNLVTMMSRGFMRLGASPSNDFRTVPMTDTNTMSADELRKLLYVVFKLLDKPYNFDNLHYYTKDSDLAEDMLNGKNLDKPISEYNELDLISFNEELGNDLKRLFSSFDEQIEKNTSDGN